MEKDEKGNNIFDDVSANLRNGTNIVLLGAPSVGKTYELINTFKESGDVVFITFDKIEEKDEKVIKDNQGKIINHSQLNQLNENDFLNKIVIIDDFYKVYVKCKEDDEIFNNLLKILKNEVNSKAICLSTTPYRFEWLYEEHLLPNGYGEIIDKYGYIIDKKLTYFEISEEEARKRIIEKYPEAEDNIKSALKKCKYIHEFKSLNIENYDSYAPFALLSCGVIDTSRFLSKLKSIFVKEGYVALSSEILKEISKFDPLKKAFENKIAAFLGDAIFSGICSVPFFTLLSGLGKGKNKNTIPEFFSQLENASPTEIENLEKDGKLEPLTIYYFKESLKPENQEKLLKLIKEFPKIQEILKEHEKEFEKIWKEIGKIREKLDAAIKILMQCGLVPIKTKILEDGTDEKNKESDKTKYYKGIKIKTWSPIIYNFDVRRKQTDEVLEDILLGKSVLVLGGMGSGKTQLIKRVAYELHNKNWKVFFPKGNIDVEKAINKLNEIEGRKLVVIDNVHELKENITTLLRDKTENIQVLIAEQTGRWNEKIGLGEEQLKEWKVITKKLMVEKEDIKRCFNVLGIEPNEKLIDRFYDDSKKFLPWIIIAITIFGFHLQKGKIEKTDADSVEIFFEDMQKYFKSRKEESLSTILPLLAVGYYEGEYPKDIFYKVYGDEKQPYLNNLQDDDFISVGDKTIFTFHQYICREFLLRYYRNDQKILFRAIKKYLEKLIENVDDTKREHKEYLSILHTIGTNIAIEADKEKDNEKREIGVKYFEKVIKINPNYADAHNNLGVLLSDLKRYEEAEKEFREAIRINPNDAGAHNNLGNLLKNLKRYEEAEKEYREAIRINPNYAEAHNNLGLLLKDLNRYEEAEKEYREAIRINPNYAEAHNNLGNLLTQHLKRYEEAEKEFREAIRINPNYAEAHNNLGLLLKDLNRYEEAEKEYREAIRLNPNLAEAHYNLGNLLQNLNHYEEAEKEYREAIRINPNLAEAHYNLGNLLQNLNHYEEAEKEYREAIRINPNDAGAHNNLGALLANLNHYEEAEKEFREAIRINPNYAEAHYNLGVLLQNLKRYEEVEKEYREAIRINPNYAEAHNNLGILLKNLKRYEEAEKEYREAIRINPNDAEAHNNLGILLKNLKRYEEAEKEYKEAIRINPNLAEAHANLGILYLQQGKINDAQKELEIAHELFLDQCRFNDANNVLKILQTI